MLEKKNFRFVVSTRHRFVCESMRIFQFVKFQLDFRSKLGKSFRLNSLAQTLAPFDPEPTVSSVIIFHSVFIETYQLDASQNFLFQKGTSVEIFIRLKKKENNFSIIFYNCLYNNWMFIYYKRIKNIFRNFVINSFFLLVL